MKVLVTGATGFIGSALIKALARKNQYHIIASSRRESDTVAEYVEKLELCEITSSTNWRSLITGVDCVVHTAGVAHVLGSRNPGVLDDSFREINTFASINLASQAADCGVKRFIYLSSIGVNGNVNDLPFTESSKPNPCESYAKSKYEAEKGIFKIGSTSEMEVVVIRPPLVYGPNAPGNFSRLVKLVEMGCPLPFASLENKRTLISIDNLADFISVCIIHPLAANQLFLIGDSEDVSTSELLRKVARALGRPERLFSCPERCLRVLFDLVGRTDLLRKLSSTLTIDSTKARTLLDWKPLYSLDQGLAKIRE